MGLYLPRYLGPGGLGVMTARDFAQTSGPLREDASKCVASLGGKSMGGGAHRVMTRAHPSRDVDDADN